MCTAATYQTKDLYFGRTLDYLFSYGEEVVITPRNYPFSFRHMPGTDSHFAMIGMAHVAENYPLYYDAVNEKGLCIAGLNFPKNAVYHKPVSGRLCFAQFELIPWLLSRCSTVREARTFLADLVLTDESFAGQLPPSPLHWIIADASEAITVESVADGLKVYENPVGVLTNNPPFDRQLFNLNNYMNLSPKQPKNCFSDQLSLSTYCLGMGALGLPGDLSSMSRFVRAAFTKMNAVSGDSEEESVSQFFHILGSVDQQRGCSIDENGKYEITLYTSCCNAAKGIYYYTTYNNHQITAVDMRRTDLASAQLARYPLKDQEQIFYRN